MTSHGNPPVSSSSLIADLSTQSVSSSYLEADEKKTEKMAYFLTDQNKRKISEKYLDHYKDYSLMKYEFSHKMQLLVDDTAPY